MKCPACETEMNCLPGNRYSYSAFLDKIHYHCTNSTCPARVESNYISHFCTLTQAWPYEIPGMGGSCHEYHLPFKVDGKWYYLIGQQEAFSGTILRTADNPEPVTLVSFLYIRTDEDMDFWAWKAFKRLKDLLVFA